MPMRIVVVLVAAVLLLVPALPAAAVDEDPSLEFFYPVVTRRPVIERELELKFRHEKSSGGRETELAGALELPILPWWQIELEVPLVFTSPNDASSQAGFGDLELESKFLLWKSVQQRVLVAGGFVLVLLRGSGVR